MLDRVLNTPLLFTSCVCFTWYYITLEWLSFPTSSNLPTNYSKLEGMQLNHSAIFWMKCLLNCFGHWIPIFHAMRYQNQRLTRNPAKHLKWSVLQKWYSSKFIFKFLTGNTLFGEILVRKLKIPCINWNLVRRLIRMCIIHWWSPVFSLSTKTLSWANLVQKIKIVALSWSLVPRPSNMQSSMVVFTSTVLEWKYTFWVSLVLNIKIFQFQLKFCT